MFAFPMSLFSYVLFPLPSQCDTEDLAGTPESHARSPCARASAYDKCHTIHLVTSLQ